MSTAAHHSHKWAWTMNFNSGTCQRCGLRCGRERGGDGWPPGDWRYYGKGGNYTPERYCAPPNESEGQKP